MRRTPLRARARIALIFAILAAAASSLFAFPTPSMAADPTLEVVQVGWGGLTVQGSWSPVRVRLTGGDADLSGIVEVVTRARYQPGGPQSTPTEFATGAYGLEIALPAGVTKEVTLWVPGENSYYSGSAAQTGSVRLVTGGRIAIEERIEFRSSKTPYWPVMGVLADSAMVARSIEQIELPVQGLPIPLNAARLSAADIPASAERLGALKAIVVQGSSAAVLTGEQRAAILEWITAGGHLVLMGGPDAPRATSVLPAGTVHVTFSGADGSADLTPLVRWAEPRSTTSSSGPAAIFRAEGGSVLAGTPERPLAWRTGIGQGTVTLLAADPGLEPLASWPAVSTLMRKAMEPAIPAGGDMEEKMRIVQMQGSDLAMRLQGAVEALPPEAFPSWQLVALLLGGFLLIAGPLLHFALWRTDRRVWIWAIVPAVAVLLAGGMYYLGVGREGRDILVNVITHLRLSPDGNSARQTVIAGFFAPTHSNITVNIPGDVSVRPQARADYQMYGGPYGMPSAPSAEPPFRVVAGRETRVEFSANQWGMRSVFLSRSLEKTGGVTAHIELDGGLLKGTVRNDTPYTLENAAILMGQGVARLDTLAPGQTAQVVLDPGPPSNPFGGRYPIAWRVLGKPRTPGDPGASPSGGVAVAVAPAYVSSRAAMLSSSMPYPGGMQEDLVVPQDPEVQRRLRLLEPIVEVPRAGPSAQSMALTFFGFIKAPVGKDLPSAAGHPSYHLTLLEQPLQLILPPGPFTIPGSMAPGEIINQTGGLGGGGNGTINWLQIQGGSVTYSFRPPLPANAKTEALRFTTQQMGPSSSVAQGKGMGPVPPNAVPGPAESGVFSVYNWRNASWEPLTGGKENTRLEPAAPFIGPNGEVRLQVTAAPDRLVVFVQPELSVEGRVEQ